MANINLENIIDTSDIEDTADLAAVWDVVSTPIFRVVDEDGVNVSGGRCRRLDRSVWIYVDDTDGYELLEESAVERLFLVPIEKHVAFGWDQAGNVVAL